MYSLIKIFLVFLLLVSHSDTEIVQFNCGLMDNILPNETLSDTTRVTPKQSMGFQSTKISFSELQDTIIKHEVATFTAAGAYLLQNSIGMVQLTEFPINSCSESGIQFSKNSAYINLCFEQHAQSTTLDSIFLVIKNHLWVRIPNHTYVGINLLQPCPFIPHNRRKKVYSPYYKAFQSKDKLRYYIYLQGGVDSHKYEATWVVSRSRFYAFVTDSI